ncbi:MAG: hypothetical protein HRU38_19785 [Saccharospirillaceae bacterium]|nr:hypothetical protein [Pseudomonadales bacterium]NRB80877.1 hypothetical protein [Saccharospirillaceae bacterium]
MIKALLKTYLYYPLNQRLFVDLLRDDINQNVKDATAGALVDHLEGEHPMPHVCIEVKNLESFKVWIEPRLQMCSFLYFDGQCQWIGRKLHFADESLYKKA